MKLRKSIVAVTSAVAIALSCAGCADVSKMGTIDGKEIGAGLYLWFENGAINEAQSEIDSQLQKSGTNKSEIKNFSYLDYNVQNVPFAQYVKDRTLELAKQYVAVQNRADELGVKLNDEETKTISDETNKMWNSEMTYYGYSMGYTYGEYYEKMGIGKQTYKIAQMADKLSKKLFDKYYEEGGLTPTDEKDIKTYYNDHYGRFGIISISTTAAKTDEAKAELKKLAEGYLSDLKGGKDFDEVYHAYETYLEDKKKAEEAEKNSSSSTTSSETSSVVESTTSSDTSSSTDSTTTSEEEEEKHDHDQIVAKGEDDSDKYRSFLFGLKEGEKGMYEAETYIYVATRMNLLEREDWFENYRSDILHIMKDEDFGKIMNDFAKDYVVNFSAAALDAYKPEVVINR